MELGGKSALIVFDDADVASAVEWAMFGCFWTTGQICSATSRLLVHEVGRRDSPCAQFVHVTPSLVAHATASYRPALAICVLWRCGAHITASIQSNAAFCVRSLLLSRHVS